MNELFHFYEFFCGGGMARAGLGDNWKCLFANDFSFKKGESYKENWGCEELKIEDVSLLKPSLLPGTPDLIWASFPCQDLSLAGMGAGLKGDRSGTFWPFWNIIRNLAKEGRNPSLIVLENVCGTLTSHEGEDFSAICKALSSEGYVFGAVVIDAADFVPQSRPRLFIIGFSGGKEDLEEMVSNQPDSKWHTDTLVKAQSKLDKKTKTSWMWWNLPYPPARNIKLADIIEDQPTSVKWHTKEETKRLISLMSPTNLKKLKAAKEAGTFRVGTIYKRTRTEAGKKRQRAEVRFDDTAGCLRTPTGGSSRQIIMTVNGNEVRSRLLSSREAARLMGLPDTYNLPGGYNEAYHLLGDGLVIPVVSYLSQNLLAPILLRTEKNKKAA